MKNIEMNKSKEIQQQEKKYINKFSMHSSASCQLTAYILCTIVQKKPCWDLITIKINQLDFFVDSTLVGSDMASLCIVCAKSIAL